ncbi:ricin-type beta-trefoil lectin domain protein [Kitasatospora hibisci]|uniref:ricin-type beta-trefoil lectin domain protein n=1 Tax=Kitasatospora hibisci TaxID=3369522 RepID=UPI003754B4EE
MRPTRRGTGRRRYQGRAGHLQRKRQPEVAGWRQRRTRPRHSTLCLEIPGWNQAPGAQVGLWYCTNNANQQWPATANPPTGPSYTTSLTPQYDTQGNTTSRTTTSTTTLPSAVATGTTALCLDADGAHNANGTAVQSWTCNGTGAQNWTIGTDGTLRVLGACVPEDFKSSETVVML